MPILGNEQLLRVERLSSGYGNIRVLHEVTISLAMGEIVALLGPNGAGKTTLLRAVSGLLPSDGRILLNGERVGGGPRWMTRHGLVHVIEGHRVFTQLSVRDNLMLAAFDICRAERARRMEEALSYFPELTPKLADRGGSLSGGQQQMLAVAQGLMMKPNILMLDEPSAGLSPVLVDRVLSVLCELRKKGVGILLVEQLVQKSLAVADRIYVMARGQIELESDAKANGLAERLHLSYLG